MKGNANDYNQKITNAFAEVLFVFLFQLFSNCNWINISEIDKILILLLNFQI